MQLWVWELVSEHSPVQCAWVGPVLTGASQEILAGKEAEKVNSRGSSKQIH